MARRIARGLARLLARGGSCGLLLLAGAAWGQPPAPIQTSLFSFPGALESPSGAVSAGLALADTWLGERPFSNPAAPLVRLVTLSPLLARVSRQDLRAANRNYDEQAGFFDGAGVSLGVPRTPFWLYAYRPLLRRESYAFTRGTGTDPAVIPAVISGQAEVREARAGLAAAFRVRGIGVGAAAEWTRRDDRYRVLERSGSPDQGEREVEFGGDGVGWTAGLRYVSADSGAGRWAVGTALRSVPRVAFKGTQRVDLLSTGPGEEPVRASRAPGWEGGIAASYAVTEAFRVLAAVAGRAAQDWEGFDVTSGSGSSWRVAGEFHDARDPWTLRFGVGQEHQSKVPEPRAGVVGIGLGWDMEGVLLDVGALRRTFARAGAPNSYDDRVVGSVTVGF